ncbi:MAG: APC family permease [Candidatus Heimdallarchaeota archaeon]
MSESKTYVRDATGLVREIGVVTATIFILSNVVGAGWQKRVFQTTGWAPLHPSKVLLVDPLVVAFLLTGIAAISTVFVFAVMATAMPRAGGGYVYISRVISPGVGFVSAWAEFLGIAISYGLIAVIVVEFTVLFMPVAGVTAFDFLDDPLWYTILGIVFTFLFAGIAFFGTSMTGKLLHVMFWIPAVITVAIYAMLIMGVLNTAAMETGIQNVTGATANQWIADAVSQGLDVPANQAPDYFSAVNTAILGAYWSWIGYAAISFAAGEVKEANRSLPISHLAAGFLILGIYMSISTLMSMAASVGTHASGWKWFQAVSFNNEQAANPTYTGYNFMPFVAAVAADGLGFGFLAIFFAIAGVLWLANDLPPFITTSSRILFAMSFDRALPEAFAKVDERWHSPTNAITATAIIAILGVFAEAGTFGLNGVIHIPVLAEMIGNGVVATDLLDGIFFTMACVAAIMLPGRMKDVYERTAWRPKVFGREGIVVIGWIALISNIYLDLVILGEFGILVPMAGLEALPLIGAMPIIPDTAAIIPSGDIIATLNWGFWTVVVMVIIGAVIYFYMKSYYSRRGVDFTTIYASIPPE